MKTAYQQFNSAMKPAIRQIMEQDGVDFEGAFRGIMAEVMREMPEMANNAMMQRCIALNKCVHLFIQDAAFLDWLVACAPTLDDGAPEAMLQMTGGEACVLHFPTTSKYRCVAFKYLDHTNRSADKPSLVLTLSCIAGKSPTGMILFDQTGAVDYGPIEIYIRLLNALGLYLACFPEMLRTGPPEDVKHPSHHQYVVSKTVGISPKVRVRTEPGEVTAHFRKGHFRILRSERFTHKRWRAVFVKATFVKGESLTILSPEQA